MHRETARQVINELVEAEFDRLRAQRLLEGFSASTTPPAKPNDFGNLQAFADFYEEQQGYKDELRSFTDALDEATRDFRRAESAAKGILPENTPLYFDYDGDREDLKGMRYAINHMAFTGRGQGNITISSSKPTSS